MPLREIVRVISGSAIRSRVFFICLTGAWSNRFHGPGWGGRTSLMLCSLTPRRAAYGLAFIWVAWHISVTVRFAHRTQDPMGWARAVWKTFNATGTVRSGLQLRGG